MTPRRSQELNSVLDELLRQEQRPDGGEDFDVQRARIHALGLESLPGVLQATQDPHYRPLWPLLVKSLADLLYPPALPHLVAWMTTHDDPNVRFDATVAIDQLAGEPHRVAQMTEDGWIQHDQVARAADALKTWWDREARHHTPSLDAWERLRRQQRRRSPREEVFGFVLNSPGWVVLEDGRVLQPRGELPRHTGIYVVGGKATLNGMTHPTRVVVELDSSSQRRTVWIWSEQGWLDVTDDAHAVTHAAALGTSTVDDLSTPFRLSPTPDSSVSIHLFSKGCHPDPPNTPTRALTLGTPHPDLNLVLATLRGLLAEPPDDLTVAHLARWAVDVPAPAVLDYIHASIASWDDAALKNSFAYHHSRLAAALRARAALDDLRRDIAWLLTTSAEDHPADNVWLAEALGPLYANANVALGAHEFNRNVRVEVPPWAPSSVWIIGGRGVESYHREDTVILEWRASGDWCGGSFSYYDGWESGDFLLEEDWWFEARRDALAPLMVDWFPGLDPENYGLPTLTCHCCSGCQRRPCEDSFADACQSRCRC